MAGRILIISDTHLGRARHAARSAQDLAPLWRGMSHLILNGDIAEVHHPRHRAAAAREMVHLLDACERDDVHVTLLSGNHDPFISDHRHLELCNGEVFITHGDVVHPAVAPWSISAGRMKRVHAEAIRRLRHESSSHIEARLTASQLASHAEWDALEQQARLSALRGMLLRPWSIVEVVRYWRRFPRLVDAFASEYAPTARFIITGHTHRAGIWKRNERTILNTGCFGFPSRPHGVVISDDTLAFHRIIETSAGYELDRQPLATFQTARVSAESLQLPSAVNTRPLGGFESAEPIKRPAAKSFSS